MIYIISFICRCHTRWKIFFSRSDFYKIWNHEHCISHEDPQSTNLAILFFIKIGERKIHLYIVKIFSPISVHTWFNYGRYRLDGWKGLINKNCGDEHIIYVFILVALRSNAFFSHNNCSIPFYTPHIKLYSWNGKRQIILSFITIPYRTVEAPKPIIISFDNHIKHNFFTIIVYRLKTGCKNFSISLKIDSCIVSICALFIVSAYSEIVII